jgi:hypothetical protein
VLSECDSEARLGTVVHCNDLVQQSMLMPPTSGFGGLAVSMLASGTQDRGFEKNPQHAFLRRGSKAVCPHVAALRHVKESYNDPTINLTSHFSPIIQPFANRGLSRHSTWSASADERGN